MAKADKIPGRCTPGKKLGGVWARFPETLTLTLFKTKNGDFPYPIYDLPKISITY